MIGLIQNKTIYEYDIRSLILAFMLGEKIELTDHVDSIYDFILDVDYKDQEIVMNLYKKGELEDEIQLFGDYENKKIFKNRMKQGIYQLKRVRAVKRSFTDFKRIIWHPKKKQDYVQKLFRKKKNC